MPAWTPFRFVSMILLLAFPAWSLAHRSGPGVAVHVFAGLGLIQLAVQAGSPAGRSRIAEFWHRYWPLCVAFALPLLVNMTSMGIAGRIGDAFSTPLQRLALGTFVFFALLSLPWRTLIISRWGILAGAMAACIILYVASLNNASRPTVEAHNLLNYTNFVVLLGVYCLYLLHWRDEIYINAKRAASLLAFAAVVYAVVLSGSRGPLLSFVLLLVLYAFTSPVPVALRWRALAGVAVAGILLAMALQSPVLRKGLELATDATVTSLPRLLEGKTPAGGDSSTRIRLGLWKASWLMAKDHPWIGDGSRSFAEKLADLNKAGLIDDESTWRGPKQTDPFTQPHNEWANSVAMRGLAGMLALSALYFVPLAYFARRRHAKRVVHRMAAYMGLATVIGFILFGFTVSQFTAGWMAALYVLLVGLFIAISHPPESRQPAATPLPTP